MNTLNNYQKRLLSRMKKDSDSSMVSKSDGFRTKLYIRWGDSKVTQIKSETYGDLEPHLCLVNVRQDKPGYNSRKGRESLFVHKHPAHVQNIVNVPGMCMMSPDMFERFEQDFGKASGEEQ